MTKPRVYLVSNVETYTIDPIDVTSRNASHCYCCLNLLFYQYPYNEKVTSF
jgi:hypothetical protein